MLAHPPRSPNHWFRLRAGDVATGVQHQTNDLALETTTSASFKTADLEVAGSSTEKSKSLVIKAGDVATGVQQQTNALSRE